VKALVTMAALVVAGFMADFACTPTTPPSAPDATVWTPAPLPQGWDAGSGGR
jgi:hypothetical protein